MALTHWVVRGLCALACTMSGAVVSHASTHLTFCYDPYPPYTLGTEGAPTGGIKVELLEAVVARIDSVSADIVLMPWKRCQEEVRRGSVDGILPLFSNTDRAAYMAFTDPVFSQSSALWYSADAHPEIATWTGNYAEVSHLRLGMLNGSYIDAEMETAFSSQRPIVRANSVGSLFRMLQFDRIDTLALDERVAAYFVAQNDLRDVFVPMPVMIAPRPTFLGLSMASGADVHLNAFNQALAELQAEGRIETIYTRGW